jgi:hypothetical protein
MEGCSLISARRKAELLSSYVNEVSHAKKGTVIVNAAGSTIFPALPGLFAAFDRRMAKKRKITTDSTVLSLRINIVLFFGKTMPTLRFGFFLQDYFTGLSGEINRIVRGYGCSGFSFSGILKACHRRWIERVKNTTGLQLLITNGFSKSTMSKTNPWFSFEKFFYTEKQSAE